ncbi:MAG: hypothetical protein LKJ86_09645, partial [Oscillibacter sp.]|nr:hypothetical protein [Oscillibacter sp.]
ADVRALGASVDGIQVLLDTFSTEGAVVGTLTNQQVDHGAPYPASFGTLGQFGCDLPSGAQYTLTAVTYLNGKSLGETELTSGSTDDLGSMFWLSCSMDMGRWDALYWTLYPEKEKNRAVELSVPLDGHGASYSFRDFSWFGQEAGGVTQAISARTPLMAFAVSSAGDDPIIVPCETLTSSSSLERFGSSNAVAAVVYLNLSAGHSAAESAGKTT